MLRQKCLAWLISLFILFLTALSRIPGGNQWQNKSAQINFFFDFIQKLKILLLCSYDKSFIIDIMFEAFVTCWLMIDFQRFDQFLSIDDVKKEDEENKRQNANKKTWNKRQKHHES